MPSDMSTNHLLRRGARYYIRRRVPAELQQHFGGKKEIVRALGTADRREAERLVREQSVLLDREFEALRSPGGPPRLEPELVADPDTGEPLWTGEWVTYTPPNPAHVRQVSDLPDESFTVDPDEAERRARIQRAKVEDARRFRATARVVRAAGIQPPQNGTTEGPEVTPTPVTPPATKQRNTAPGSSSAGHLSALVEAWAAERKPERDSIQRANRVVMRFYEHVGRIPVRDITRANVLAFKNALLEAGQSAPNVKTQLAILAALLAYAVANLMAEHNAAQGVKVADRRNARAVRLPFDLAALQAIFSGPVYSDAQYAQPYGAASYWLPLLALFTGARLEELGQLSPDDVYEDTYRTIEGDERKAWVIRLTGEGEGQGVKNSGSNRRIPVHAELIRLGFVEYAQGQRGKARIFDRLKADRNGREASKWSGWFGKYLRTVCGVTDSRMVFHSFRHTWKDLAREAHVPEDVSDAITGHSSDKVSRRYGGMSYPLGPMVEAMGRIRVAELELPKNYSSTGTQKNGQQSR